jgi:hypothetical protein
MPGDLPCVPQHGQRLSPSAARKTGKRDDFTIWKIAHAGRQRNDSGGGTGPAGVPSRPIDVSSGFGETFCVHSGLKKN